MDSYFLFAEEQGYHRWALAHSSSCLPGCHDRDRMVLGFTTTYAISAYHHLSCEFDKYQISAINSCWEKCDEKCAYMFNVYKNQLSRQTGSRNPMGPKTLPTIWGTYMMLVTKYQISVINSCWEKCDEKCAYMFNVYKNQLSRQTGSRNLMGPKTLPTIWVGFYTHWTYMHIFLSNYWWQRSDIWSQASYRYPISWEAFLDPSDSYFLFADLVGFYTHW
jgi:hypothetical protein